MTLKEIADSIKSRSEKIILIYAFNSTGKTRLSLEYKENARNADGKQTGVYFNAYSEDLFVWDNDIFNAEENIRLKVVRSSLNGFHSFIDEEWIKEKLIPYKPKYDFEFHYGDNPEDGIEYISFYANGEQDRKCIKISRGEERIFIWCFFLALFEAEGWADIQNEYIFIDDPVSSLDDHNIFVTAYTLFNLIKNNFDSKKIVITTHHIGFATILGNWLQDSNNPFKVRGNNAYLLRGLSVDNGDYSFNSFERNTVWLYHLRLMQVIDNAIRNDENDEGVGLEVYHMALLRQLLENISSFLGVGRINFVLKEIGFTEEEANHICLEDNALTHRNVYFPQSDIMTQDNKNLIKDVFGKICDKYHFDYKKLT